MPFEAYTSLVGALLAMAAIAGVLGMLLVLQAWLNTQLRRVQVAATSVVVETQGVLGAVGMAMDTVNKLVLLGERTGDSEVQRRVRTLQELALEARLLSIHSAELLAQRERLSGLRAISELRLLRSAFHTVVQLRKSADEQIDWIDGWLRASARTCDDI